MNGNLIVSAFEKLAARRASDAIAVSRGCSLSFGQLDSLAGAVAARLADDLGAPGGIVGLAAPNGSAFLAGLLALRRAGQCVLLLDPLAPPEEQQRVVTVMDAAGVLCCDTPWPASSASFRLFPRGEKGRRAPLPRDIAVVKLTSGSTGVPRGVATREEALLADEEALALAMGLRDGDRLLAAIPMSHSYGFTTLALSALIRGLTLVLPEDQSPFAPLAAAHDLRASVFPTVPAWLGGLVRISQPPPWPGVIRLVISAGAVLSSSLAAQFREMYALPVHAFYGSSECGGICYDRDGGAAERGTVGSAVEGVRITLEPWDEAEAGEGLVTVESPAVAQTYVPEPEPALGAGRFQTSDVGTWHEGELALRRRVGQVINIRGRKVDPTEVEAVLARLPGVVEVVVLGVGAPERGHEVVRAVVACPSGQLRYEDVAAWCRPRLADHKVPRSVIIVDAIPRTSRGKIDRAALRILRSPEQDPA